ncbi:hypothetical protein OHB12_00350 [Nocardia sp. NBC_01730]|uniref:hypothetical protein n=1 Tax=Nocardia sp. NBC_01730 TaxID=2975998 RepID=UPI002E0DE5AC|nr:hypothetical protein OHB12_00350 [Nocardia sp. NBC_01730]
MRTMLLTATLQTTTTIATLVRMPHTPLTVEAGGGDCAQSSTKEVVTWSRPKAFT